MKGASLLFFFQLCFDGAFNIQQVSLQHGKDFGEMRWSMVGWSRDFKNWIPGPVSKYYYHYSCELLLVVVVLVLGAENQDHVVEVRALLVLQFRR